MKQESAGNSIIVKDILCDICGDSVIPHERMKHSDNFNDFSEHAQLSAEFGYGSQRDGDRIHYDFCETCFEKIVAVIEGLRGAKS